MRHDLPNSNEIDSVLERALRMVAVVGDTHADVDVSTMVESVVGGALFSLRQFEVLLGTVADPAAALRLIPVVMDRAADYGIASPRAIGAAASLVDLVRSNEAAVVVDTVLGASAALGDDDVVAGMASFIASLTEQVAMQIGVDAELVHDEFCADFSVEAITCDVPAATVPVRSPDPLLDAVGARWG